VSLPRLAAVGIGKHEHQHFVGYIISPTPSAVGILERLEFQLLIAPCLSFYLLARQFAFIMTASLVAMSWVLPPVRVN
jgi:hypothetical protein